MTIRQRFLQLVYPVFMLFSKIRTGKNAIQINKTHSRPFQSFYELKAILNDETVFDFKWLRGKKVLIVNTASDCGYTRQYNELQKLFELKQGSLFILGFPSNDYKNQESGPDEDIARFCKSNYGVLFPVMKKCIVVKRENQNKVFEWLSNANRNGWNDSAPVWNFTKFLIDENGELTHVFHPSVSPLSKEMIKAIS